MTLVAPRARICSWAARLVPSAIASIEITAATPKTMPSTVSPDRSLCSKRLFIPSLSARQMRPIDTSSVCHFFARTPELGLMSRPITAPHSLSPATTAGFATAPLTNCAPLRARRIINDQSVPHPDHPLGARSNVVFVRHQMIVLPESFRRSSTSMISWLVLVSRLPVASSARMMYGSLISERAIATRCC